MNGVPLSKSGKTGRGAGLLISLKWLKQVTFFLFRIKKFILRDSKPPTHSPWKLGKSY